MLSTFRSHGCSNPKNLSSFRHLDESALRRLKAVLRAGGGDGPSNKEVQIESSGGTYREAPATALDRGAWYTVHAAPGLPGKSNLYWMTLQYKIYTRRLRSPQWGRRPRRREGCAGSRFASAASLTKPALKFACVGESGGRCTI